MSRLRGLGHPSRSRLHEWLNTGAPRGVGDHIDQCERCADRLEAIDLEDEPVRLDGSASLREVLGEIVAPPDDLGDRILHGIERRSRVERELSLITGLLSIGVETAQLMFDADQPNGSASRRPGDTEPDEKGHVT